MRPISSVGVPRETSSLLPKVDSTSPAHMWKTVAQGNSQVNSLRNALGVNTERLNRITGNSQSTMGMHPWKIYPFVQGSISKGVEDYLGITDENAYRAYRVRTGLVCGVSIAKTALQQIQTPYTHCDCEYRPLLRTDFTTYGYPHTSDTLRGIMPPFVGAMYPSDEESVRIADDNARTFIVVQLVTNFVTPEFRGCTPYVWASTDPKTGGPDMPVSWDNFPYYHPYFTLIGMIDTTTFHGQTVKGQLAEKQALHYNFVHDRIDYDYAPKYYGEWSATPKTPLLVGNGTEFGDFPVDGAGTQANLTGIGYPYNAIVTKKRTAGSPAVERNATYQSRMHFNRSMPSGETDDKWILIGESAI